MPSAWRACMESVHNDALVYIYSDRRPDWDTASCVLLRDIREKAVRKVAIDQKCVVRLISFIVV